jgi:hypothetical protein
MLNVERVRADIGGQFERHGITVSLMGQTNVQKNSLNEVILATPTETPQTIIDRGQLFGVDEQDIVTIPEGSFAFNAPSDTLLVESSILKRDGRFYEIKEMRPVRVFKEIVSFVGRAERAGANENAG